MLEALYPYRSTKMKPLTHGFSKGQTKLWWPSGWCALVNAGTLCTPLHFLYDFLVTVTVTVGVRVRVRHHTSKAMTGTGHKMDLGFL